MKENILKLRSEGKSYNQICELLGCSKSVVSYHCGDNQKYKHSERLKNRKTNNLIKSVSRFKSRTPIKRKVEDFTRRVNTSNVPKEERDGKFLKSRSDSDKNFTSKDVIEKFTASPNCYLTGRILDLYDSSTYSFDHITPVSLGGDNSLENLGICHPEANYAKAGLLLVDFFSLCKEVLEYNGYIVTKI